MDPDPTVDAIVDYCQTQAALLSGHAETLATEMDDILEDIDAEASALRERLDGTQERADSPDRPANPGTAAVDEEAIADLEQRQAAVAARQERLDTISDLSTAYLELAETVQTDDLDVTDALATVLEFEADHEVPQYFDERETLLESAIDQ